MADFEFKKGRYKPQDGGKTYAEKLKDPRWQKKRLEILSRDEWMCQLCQDSESMLVVHHRFYLKGKEPWEYADYCLVTLCQACHDHEHEGYPEYAANLIQTLKAKGFFADDVALLIDGFHAMEIRNAAEYMSSLLKFALADSDTMEMVDARYQEDAKRRIETRKQKEVEAKKAEGDNGQAA